MRGHNLFCGGSGLVSKMLGAGVAIEQLVWPARRPQTLCEEGGEGGGYLGCCGTPDGNVLWFGFGRRASAASTGNDGAVGGDVTKEEEFLARGVMSDKEGRWLIVAQHVVLTVQHGHCLD